MIKRRNLILIACILAGVGLFVTFVPVVSSTTTSPTFPLIVCANEQACSGHFPVTWTFTTCYQSLLYQYKLVGSDFCYSTQAET